jgi:hypothetical protein
MSPGGGAIRDERFGIRANPRRQRVVSLLEPTIRGWGQAIEEYCSGLTGKNSDVPYYYNERANISLLAAGAWKAGQIALEEYPTDKMGVARRRGRGRCDLFILAAKRYEFQIEAKQCWMRAEWTTKSHKHWVKTSFTAACAAANANTESSARVGCVFFSISWPAQKGSSEPTKFAIKAEIKKCTDSKAADVWAWCFPTLARDVTDDTDGEKRHYPGVIMGMKLGENFRLRPLRN